MTVDPGKIADPELQRFAEADGPYAPRSVIVELRAGPPRLTPREAAPRPRVPGPDRFAPSDLVGPEGEDGTMDQLEKELVDLGLTEDLVRLNSAQAFVVSVSPSQLRAVSRLPLVGIIRPNRTHRVPSSV